MAVNTHLFHSLGQVKFSLYPDQSRERIADDPDERNWPFWIYWDGLKLERGEREFLGIEALDVADITEYWLSELEKLDLPRIDVPEADLLDVTVADALCWARQTYLSRYAHTAQNRAVHTEGDL